MIVTIDGPAGTGKSTVARTLADALGFEFLDTGAMYRMIALRTLSSRLSPEDQNAVSELTRQTRIELQPGGTFLLDGVDVGGEIRSAEVTRMASMIAQIPQVRAQLVERQREMALSRNIVCEGRDQGTVAFPHAEHKFFLTAQPEERARRRLAELAAQGQTVEFDDLLGEQTARDQRDEERSVAPLRPAEDALIVDTTSLTLTDVVQLLRQTILKRQQQAATQQ